VNYFLLFFLILPTAHAAQGTDVCEVLDLDNCAGVSKMGRRSSAQSLPSTSTAAQFNPANVSHDRGLGVEAMYQPGNNPSLSFVTGTGKVGAALVSSKIENAFFGNSVPETEDMYFDRREEDQQYKSDKYTFALGAGLFKNRHFGLDVGLMGKYNSETKHAHPGAGLSMRLWIFTLGGAYYQDDFRLKNTDATNPRTDELYSVEWEDQDYQERFSVQNFFVGMKVKSLFLDAGVIKSNYKFYEDDTVIKIYSASYIWRNFMLNVAQRLETSDSWRYESGEDDLIDEREKKETYGGLQYSFNKHFVAGIHYNYYLLREYALSLAAFF